MIFFSNPKAQNQKLKKNILNSINRVIDSNKYILSNEVEKLENEFSKYIGTKYCIGVGNGTEAIEIALRSLNIGFNDEVITVSHTAPATISGIFASGAKPVLIDIERNHYNINSTLIEKSITKKTKCIILVHLYGLVADLGVIKKLCNKYSIYLIEDASQAHGAIYKGKRVGSLGNIGCFSCYPTKNLGAIGDAGLITTDSRKTYNKIIRLREYGWNKNKVVGFLGYNSRIDEIQAAILRVKLKYLDKDNKRRRKIAKFYEKNIKNNKIIKPLVKNNTIPVFHLYVIRCKNRQNFLNYMTKNKITCGIHYKIPTHKHPGFKKSKVKYNLSITEKICKEIVSLPIYPDLSKKDLYHIVKTINNYNQ